LDSGASSHQVTVEEQHCCDQALASARAVSLAAAALLVSIQSKQVYSLFAAVQLLSSFKEALVDLWAF
jgi:hypothetical protein